MKNTITIAIVCVLSAYLSACAKPVPRYSAAPLRCPSVPSCRLDPVAIHTNGDLAQAYTQAVSAFAQCKLARDTLQQCLDTQ